MLTIGQTIGAANQGPTIGLDVCAMRFVVCNKRSHTHTGRELSVGYIINNKLYYKPNA